MEVIPQANPLSTIIRLNDMEKMGLKYKLIIQDLEDRIVSTAVALAGGEQHQDVERAKKACSLDFLDEDEDTGKRATRINKTIKELQLALTGEHEGDCTSAAYSCDKCYAEGLLGITSAPFNKTIGYHISEAFNNEAFGNRRTLDEAIAYLRSPITDAETSLSGVVLYDKPRFAALDILTKHKQTLSVT